LFEEFCMNKKTIVIAALLGAAILALTGCENMAHDLHKKGGGAGKTKPGSPGPLVPGAAAISLSSSQFTPVEYGYTATQAGIITVSVKNTGGEATGPLSIALEGDDSGSFDYPISLESIEPGGKDEFDITPDTGLVPEDYVAQVRVSGAGGIGGSLDRTFTVGFNGVIDVGTPAAISNVVEYTSPVITIKPSKAVRVTGNTTTNRIVVKGDASDHLTYIELVDASITGVSTGSALMLEAGAKVTLNLEGGITSELKTVNGNSAGIEAPDGTWLTITGGGRLEAEGGANSAGIGGGYNGAGGDITITGGTVTASGGDDGAGIGGGNQRAGGNITISGGTVTASGSSYGAGIGGGYQGDGGIITITGGTVTASGNYGAGIGGGTDRPGGIITITGGTVTASSSSGAGIGGGDAGPSGTIIISGGTVYARSGNASGIGYGYGGVTSGSFNINGGTPVIFAKSIKDGGSDFTLVDGIIAGSSAVTVTMGTGGTPLTVTSIAVTLLDAAGFTVPAPATLTIPAIATLDLGGYILTNNGEVTNKGRVHNGSVNDQGIWNGIPWE
jgi:hypothetical protein